MENGNPTRHDNGVERVAVDYITVTLQRTPWTVNISGCVESEALALAMLRQAVDCYEARLRMANAQAMAAQLQQQQENARIAAEIRRK